MTVVIVRNNGDQACITPPRNALLLINIMKIRAMTLMTTSQITAPIAFLGGTFDPIHWGHLSIALEIQRSYLLTEVQFIPCWQPVHRDTPLASPKERLEMLNLAIKDEPSFKIEDCEIKRQGPSYTIDTLIFLREKFPHTPLCLILGADAWTGFATWHHYEEILNLAHLIIAARPAYPLPTTGKLANLLEQHQKRDAAALHNSLAGNIIVHSLSAIDISATVIRNQIALGQNPETLLPKNVYEYILAHHLYESKK